jgi:microcystin-dependent protein
MPDDSSGNYTLSPGYLAVTGQTIQPSQHNPPLEDIATAMTARLPRSGVAPMTGPLKTITGSAGAPAISPNNNPAIGIYWTPTGVAFAGTVAGVRFIGELIPYTLLTAPALTVFPYGQTLLRASFPDLWTLAQTEIAAGNTFYNNGNGTTTFGIGDMRGRVPAGKDDMGGTPAGRLTATYYGSDAKVLGAANGNESVTMALANMIQHDHTVFLHDPGHTHSVPSVASPSVQAAAAGGGPAFQADGKTATASSATTGITLWSDGDNSGTQNKVGKTGSATPTPMRTAQPTLIINYVLYAGA